MFMPGCCDKQCQHNHTPACPQHTFASPADTLGTERVKGQKEQAVHAQCLRELEDRVQVSTTQQPSTFQLLGSPDCLRSSSSFGCAGKRTARLIQPRNLAWCMSNMKQSLRDWLPLLSSPASVPSQCLCPPPLCAVSAPQSKLTQLSRLEERLDVKLAIAAELPGQFEGLAKQQAAAEAAMETYRKDAKVGRQLAGRHAACHMPVAALPDRIAAAVKLVLAWRHLHMSRSIAQAMGGTTCCAGGYGLTTVIAVPATFLLLVLQRMQLQLSQVEHQQSLAASEAALAPLNPYQRSQVRCLRRCSRCSCWAVRPLATELQCSFTHDGGYISQAASSACGSMTSWDSTAALAETSVLEAHTAKCRHCHAEGRRASPHVKGSSTGVMLPCRSRIV
jgi:hypothetical protein